jgi:hypothetical protein
LSDLRSEQLTEKEIESDPIFFLFFSIFFSYFFLGAGQADRSRSAREHHHHGAREVAAASPRLVNCYRVEPRPQPQTTRQTG